MISTSAIPQQMEIPLPDAAPPQARDEFRIEEVLRRARQIHREHGGFFGYDFDDWAQAWAELPLIAGQAEVQGAAEDEAESVPAREREALEPCFGCGR